MILLSLFFRQSGTYECDQFGDLEKPIRVHYSPNESQLGENFVFPLAIFVFAGNNNRQNVEFCPALKETDCGTSRTLRRLASIFHGKKLVESTCEIVL
jgi:hypothetical protein